VPFVPTPGAVKVAIIGSLSGQECINLLHFWKTPPISITDLDNLSGDIQTWIDNHLKPLMPTNWSCASIALTDLSSSISPSKTYVFTPKVGGDAQGAQPSPTNSAIVVSKRTNNRGRSYRGRFYSPVSSGQYADTTSIVLTFATALVSAFSQLLTSSSFHSFVFSVISTVLNKALRGAGVATPITAVSVDTKLDSARRRLSGRGA
jgi:hypothetical protein